mmetsp:Transcript_15320/g.51527  ORF Transcript_15320/g.51527 Transcript_15320/m.51527 type:complete len:220 (+) Transcript_15320:1938-2597(+)
MLPMLTRRRPDCGYCLFLTRREYVCRASSGMPAAWYACAKLKHTAYVKSILIDSVRPLASRCLHKARSRLPASLAFSKAKSKFLSSAAAAAEASMSLCTWRSYSLDLSSGELSAFSASGGAGPRPCKGSNARPPPAEPDLVEKPAPETDVMGRTSPGPPAKAVPMRDAPPRGLPMLDCSAPRGCRPPPVICDVGRKPPAPPPRAVCGGPPRAAAPTLMS